ncbi:tRNA (N6-threonylcarbamoyladenosine(37)-N6)-methyltransferase TrmO [Thalassotalea maritima]|uniref:tRNA (N6-threonylcarbamoyladenosine(37)-N6)-methyltransferase TrmO n=1 Tax=Thalassotalea maritima TaxID=3242416 RepID=UPI003528D522
MSHDLSINVDIIGKVHSPYKQKFAIPRQPNLVSAAEGSIELLLDCQQHELVRDLEQHSHLWVLFIFHGTMAHGWKPLVKAPRLGGNKKTGVLATRSTFRPNPIGMSVVKLEGISKVNGNICIRISGLDLLDGTPVIDIKPYIPYSDSVPHAQSDMAPAPQSSPMTITFSDKAKQQLASLGEQYGHLALFIEQVLQQDPRPAYKKQDDTLQEYGMSLYDLNIRWQISSQQTLVIDIEPHT